MSRIPSEKLKFAKQLRKNQTDTERKLWQLLRSRQLAGFKFRRQRPIGPYIVDFCCLNSQLIIELDGGQHQEAKSYDQRRTDYLKGEGFQVIRFWDNEVLQHSEDVVNHIFRALTLTLSHLPPLKLWRTPTL